MKRLLFALLFLFTIGMNFAQVDVTASGGDPSESYATLKAAFDSINTGFHTGTITIGISGNTTEIATAVLNASGTGSASYTGITISPSGGAARTISGAITAGSPLIDLNGADNVTFNGLNTGGNALTISNTTASATSGTSTIRFVNGATSNTITKCTVLGSFSGSAATNGGNIYFATDASTTNGNDNNTVSNCDIGPEGANLSTKGVYGNGTTTTADLFNSGITINGNNIYDYFGATVTSAGVYAGGGCTDWTVSNNKFYQTASRVQTTGGQHSAIWIVGSSGNNHLVSGNTIGFANSSGTGTYSFDGVAASKLIPIYLSVGTTTATSVQGNTITAMAMSGAASGTSSSASFRGIYVAAGLTKIGDITGNTIGSMSSTGSITFTSSSTSAADVIGMFNFGTSNWTVSNNNIGGISASNSSTGAANVYGIRLNTSSTAVTTISNNTIGGSVANSLQSGSAAATTGTQVVGIYVSTSIATVSGNTVRNLTAPGGTGTTTGASVIGINYISTTPVQTLSQNTIYNLTNTNTTAATIVTGIQFTGGTGNVVERNFIYALTSATNSATAEVNGIRVAGGTTIYRNNMIALGEGISYALGSVATNSSTSGINGINGFLGTDQMFHNSVYIGGTANDGIGASYAFNGTQTVNTRSFRDNIFFNARTNGGTATGKHYAVKLNGTVPNPTGLTINNNVYFANGTGAVFGFYNSLDVANLAAWKTAIGQDANSFEGNPQYNNPTATTPDLHIHPTNVTVIEGNGVDLGVLNDYDGQTRSGLTPVDIGADAGNFAGIDLSAPSISYTPLSSYSSSLISNTLTPVTITDVTGVNGSTGTAPRIYYKKTTNANAFVGNTSTDDGWKWKEATGSSPFTLVIDYSLLFPSGTVSLGDTIQYFVVAQDIASTPNVGSNPSAGFVGTSVSSITSAPTFPNQYKIVGAPLSGTYTVGLTKFNEALGKNLVPQKRTRIIQRNLSNFAEDSFIDPMPTENKVDATDRLSNLEPVQSDISGSINKEPILVEQVQEYFVFFDGETEYKDKLFASSPTEGIEGVYPTITSAITDLNERGISGPVTFSLVDANYPSETYPLDVQPVIGGSVTNTVTFKPASGVNAVIPGSANQTTATFRLGGANYIIIDGSNTVGGSTRNLTIDVPVSGTLPSVHLYADASYNNFKNVKIKSRNNSTTSGTVLFGNSLSAVPGSKHNMFDNCEVMPHHPDSTRAAVGFYFWSTVLSDSNTIKKCDIYDFTTYGIQLRGGPSTGNMIEENNIYQTLGAPISTIYGIYIAYNPGTIIRRNIIGNLITTSTSTTKALHGIYYFGSSGNAMNVDIINNMVYFDGTATDDSAIVRGIDYFGYAANSVNILHNSVHLQGGAAALNSTYGLVKRDAATNFTMKNNISINSRWNGTGTGSHYAVYVSNTTGTNTLDYNNYYAGGTGGVLGYWSATPCSTLETWKSTSSQDANAKDVSVTFASATDLHLSGGSIGDGNLACAPIAGVTTDIDGNARNAYWPYMGADEVVASPLALQLTLKSLIQGFYANGNTDTISVFLSKPIAPYTRYNAVRGLTSASGAIFYLPKTNNETSYYVGIKHRNSIETWSANTITTASFPASYDFTNAQAQSFGGNSVQVLGKWCIYGGDVNQDGLVDLTDVSTVDTDNLNFVSGYVNTDVTGDQLTDISDVSLVDTNNLNFVSKQTPGGVVLKKHKRQSENKELQNNQ